MLLLREIQVINDGNVGAVVGLFAGGVFGIRCTYMFALHCCSYRVDCCIVLIM